jgi:cytochrome c-type biogenesis protein CcmH/NrfF
VTLAARRRPSSSRLLLLAPILVAGVLALVAVAWSSLQDASPSGSTEAQAQQLEEQLMCPQCAGIRLEVCELAICVDMRQSIREQLEAGATPDEVLLFFSTRYGDRVLATLPKEGFNLVLWGWVAASMLLMGGAASWWFRSQRARASAAPRERGAQAPDDRWLDEQLREAEEDPR